MTNPATTTPRTPTDRALTGQQLQVVALAAQGLTNREIGSQLGLVEQTVKSHIMAALRRIGAIDRAHLVLLTLRSGQLIALADGRAVPTGRVPVGAVEQVPAWLPGGAPGCWCPPCRTGAGHLPDCDCRPCAARAGRRVPA